MSYNTGSAKVDVIQRVATGETTEHGTVEVDVYGTVEQCTGKYIGAQPEQGG